MSIRAMLSAMGPGRPYWVQALDQTFLTFHEWAKKHCPAAARFNEAGLKSWLLRLGFSEESAKEAVMQFLQAVADRKRSKEQASVSIPARLKDLAYSPWECAPLCSNHACPLVGEEAKRKETRPKVMKCAGCGRARYCSKVTSACGWMWLTFPNCFGSFIIA